MSNFFRLGVSSSEFSKIQGLSTPQVEYIRADSWERFKPVVLNSSVAYLPNYILQRMLGAKADQNKGLIQLDENTREDYGLPRFIVSGNVHHKLPENGNKAAEIFARDILSNLSDAKFTSPVDQVVAIWTGFFTDAFSLRYFAGFLDQQNRPDAQLQERKKSRRAIKAQLAFNARQAQKNTNTRKELQLERERIAVLVKAAILKYGLTSAELDYPSDRIVDSDIKDRNTDRSVNKLD